jgi:azurin
MMLHSKIYPLLVGVLTLGLVSFGSAAADPVPDDPDQTIEIVGTDQLTYSVTEIEASPGETVRIVLTTKSALPPSSMSHNVVVVRPKTDVQAFVNASVTASDGGYVASGFEDQIVAQTEMVGDGESTEVTFTVPETPGEYPYLCTFPGHYSGGMAGKLIVK